MEALASTGPGWRELEAQGAAARRAGDRNRAIELYLQAALQGEGAGEGTPGWAHALRHVSELHREAGDTHSALAAAREVVAFYRGKAPDALEMANALRVQALAEQMSGNADDASSLWVEARELYLAEGIEPGVREAEKRIRELAENAR